MQRYNAKAISIFFLFFGTQHTYSADTFNGMQFHNTHATLAKIQEIIASEQKGAWLRFGDGDVNLANGLNDLHQKKDKHLQAEMREAFSMNGPTILKSLSLHCDALGLKEEGMYPGNQEVQLPWCINHFNKAKHLWGGPVQDVYSPVALCFMATEHPQECASFLRFLREQNVVLLVGNKDIPAHIRTLLFGSSCAFVPTPSSRSYTQIDRIERECLAKIPNDGAYKVVIVAMGCAGRPLQKRLWRKIDNVFFFDFGSLMDALCGWNTRAYIELTGFDRHAFLRLFSDEG